MSYGNPKLIARARRRDTVARYFITIGGVAIIVTVVGILLLILGVAMPLFASTSAERRAESIETNLAPDDILAIGVGDYGQIAYVITAGGEAVFFNIGDGSERDRVSLLPEEPPATLVEVQTWGNIFHALVWSDGRVSFTEVSIRTRFDEEGNRSVIHSVEPGKTLPAPDAGAALKTVARSTEEGGATRVDLLEDGQIRVVKTEVTLDLFQNETVEESSGTANVPRGTSVTEILIDQEGRFLYAGTEAGRVLRWDISDPESVELLDDVAAVKDASVAALGLIFGDVSLIVGDSAGSVSTWFPVSQGDEPAVLTRIHDFQRQTGAVEDVLPSRRNKTFMTLDANGLGTLDHMTSERRIAKFSGERPLVQFALTERGNLAAALDDTGRLSFFDIHAEHPETSWKTLFGKVWYEKYEEPAHVWQSSAATDDYEPKLSLTPLVFGSFKGTIYAMFFAVPLALFGAIYTSQFLAPEVRSIIKPIVEVMASIPSVVIGFLIALWLAPVIERFLVPFFLSLIILPLMFIPFMLVYMRLAGSSFARRVERGYEFTFTLPFLLFGVLLAYWLGPPVERLLFDGNFQVWLFESTGERYDQRNAIIIAFGLGFAAIPIIFTISEDALSNIPHGLRAASLALGASRWQTVWRVMLPSASPGIFAAVIIGFGRVIGETMIVLMATGNTPIMDWSAFNGMRTLSANIAVEIPEAPVGGTLYRVLFLSAVLLFSLTFVLNTAAELIRQRLRKKYGQFQ